MKHKLITGASEVNNQINSAPGNLEVDIQVQGNSQQIRTSIAEDKNNTKAKTMTSKNKPETINIPKISNSVKNNMYPLRITPLYVHEINSK